jgi:hypothetical protein
MGCDAGDLGFRHACCCSVPLTKWCPITANANNQQHRRCRYGVACCLLLGPGTCSACNKKPRSKKNSTPTPTPVWHVAVWHICDMWHCFGFWFWFWFFVLLRSDLQPGPWAVGCGSCPCVICGVVCCVHMYIVHSRHSSTQHVQCNNTTHVLCTKPAAHSSAQRQEARRQDKERGALKKNRTPTYMCAESIYHPKNTHPPHFSPPAAS